MTGAASSDIVAALRAFLGEERFRKFVVVLERKQELMYWQAEELERFNAAHAMSLPQEYAELWRLFRPEAEALHQLRRTLDAAQVPSFCVIDRLDGSAPVEGFGTVCGHLWYFRARWDAWELSVSGKTLEESDLFERSGEYGYDCDASYMPVEEARHFIVEALREFVAEHYPELLRTS